MSTFRLMLESLGMKIARETKKELETACPFHDDRHPSFYVNKETGAWFCHSGCGGGSFFDLDQKLKVMDLPATKSSAEIGEGEPIEAVDMDLSVLIDRGFTPAMLRRWRIEFNADVGAIEIPCYRTPEDFVGYIFRMPEGQKPKYRHPAGFPRAEVLFGIHKLLPFAEEKEVYIVEGPLDAIWLQEAGLAAVAVLGTQMTEAQADILYAHQRHHVTLCFDNDVPGQMATVVATERLRANGTWVKRLSLPKRYKDVQEIPFGEVPKLLAECHVAINGHSLIPPELSRWVDYELSGGGSGPWR